MKDMGTELPGLERVRVHFLKVLQERHEKIATHAVMAWDGVDQDTINTNLAGAQAVLHQIAGSAGSLGYDDLGSEARRCETEIIAHLRSDAAQSPDCPGYLIMELDGFVTRCQEILAQDA